MCAGQQYPIMSHCSDPILKLLRTEMLSPKTVFVVVHTYIHTYSYQSMCPEKLFENNNVPVHNSILTLESVRDI